MKAKTLNTSNSINQQMLPNTSSKKIGFAIATACVALSYLDAHAQYSPPASGLVSWWRGDGNANDSADGNNGTALNGAGYTAGVYGSAFSFDGLNDHVRVPNATNLRLTTALTVSAWVYPKSNGTFDEIISKWDAIEPSSNQRAYTFKIDPTAKAVLTLSADGTPAHVNVTSASTIPVNTWTHVAATYDGALMQVFVNGVLDGQQPYSGGIFNGTADLGIGGVVGGVASGGGISFFDGYIDEALVYNRALSVEEILILAPVPEPTTISLIFASILAAALRRNWHAPLPQH